MTHWGEWVQSTCSWFSLVQMFSNCECHLNLLLILPLFYLVSSAMRPTRLWPALPRDHPLNRLVQPAAKCTEQSTQWSACSQSCGAGVSTRVSNQNPACKLQMETRLCKVRPCHTIQPATRKPMVSDSLFYFYCFHVEQVFISTWDQIKAFWRNSAVVSWSMVKQLVKNCNMYMSPVRDEILSLKWWSNTINQSINQFIM